MALDNVNFNLLPNEIHVIVPRTSSRRRKGIRQHTNQLTPNEITQRAGLPLTTVVRTIADVSTTGLAEEQILQAIHEAIQRGLISEKELQSYAEQRGGRVKQIVQSAFGGGN